jgi:gluconolactonase
MTLSTLLTLVAALAVAFALPGRRALEAQSTSYPTIGSIERLSPALDAIVPQGAVIEVLSDGHAWVEGPVWVPALQSILYSDIPNNAIYRWREGVEASLWLRPSGYTGDVPRTGESGSNGLLLGRDGRLVLAQHGDRRLARLDAPLDAPRPVFETIAGAYEGKRFNSPNDVAQRSNGDFYFTDPPYGLQGGAEPQELDFQGVYRVSADGSVTLLTDELARPNGIVFSPDESMLYVSSSDPRSQPTIMTYPVRADGTLAEGRVFYASWGDGMTVDQQGNLYVAGPGNGVLVLSPSGEHLGTIHTTVRTSNCTFGDDGSTLYITANTHLMRVRTGVRGVGF